MPKSNIYRNVTVYVPTPTGIGLTRYSCRTAQIDCIVLGGSPRFMVTRDFDGFSNTPSRSHHRTVLVVEGEGPESITWDETTNDDGRTVRTSRFPAFSCRWFGAIIDAAKASGLTVDYLAA